MRVAELSKLLRVAAAGVMLLGVSAMSSVTAFAREAAAIPGTFTSSITISNPTNTNASVSVSFVNSSGGGALSTPLTLTVPARSSQLVYLPNVSGLSDGRYSVVVDSDQNVTAIANLTSSNPSTSASYNGVAQSDTGTSFYIPQVFNNYVGIFTTSIVVQNTHATSDANVTITYNSASGGSPITETRQIAGLASYTFDNSATTGLNSGFNGSATITSDQAVAAVVLVSAASPPELSATNGVKTGTTTMYLPSLMHDYYDFSTALVVQNVDSTDANVQVTYYDSVTNQAIGNESATIAAGKSRTFLQFDAGSFVATPRPGYLGSGVVTSTNGKNIIAAVNTEHRGWGYLSTYNASSAAGATTTVNCPTIMNNYYGFYTNLLVQNIGSTAGTITMTYKNSSGATVATETATVQAGATYSRYVTRVGGGSLPSGFNGSVVVTSNSPNIVGLVNEQHGQTQETGDQLFTYNCFNA